MTQTGFIAAIDFGSSQITGIVAKKNESDVISIIASESVESEGSIRRGVIYNVDKATSLVRKLLSMLHNKLGSQRIGKIYVSLGGQSVYTETVTEVLNLSEAGIVTEEMIARLNDRAFKYKSEFKQNYGIADVEYFVDEKSEQNPVGVSCSTLEADYKVVVGRPNLSSKIQKVIESNGLAVAGFITSPLASADIALEEQDKKLGCVYIDFGDGTTDVAIYKGGILRHMVVIPFGGKNITKDIAELNFLEKDAEQYKKKFGKAKSDKGGKSMFSSPFSAKPDIDLVELNEVIVYRLDEITANIKEQIRLSGYQDQLAAGVLISGGSSNLKKIEPYLEKKLGMAVKKVTARKSVINNVPDLVANPAYTAVLGMLLLADEDCEKVVVEEPVEQVVEQTSDKSGISWGFRKKSPKEPAQPKVKSKFSNKEEENKEKGPGIGEKIRDIFDGLFDDETDYDQ